MNPGPVTMADVAALLGAVTEEMQAPALAVAQHVAARIFEDLAASRLVTRERVNGQGHASKRAVPLSLSLGEAELAAMLATAFQLGAAWAAEKGGA